MSKCYNVVYAIEILFALLISKCESLHNRALPRKSLQTLTAFATTNQDVPLPAANGRSSPRYLAVQAMETTKPKASSSFPVDRLEMSPYYKDLSLRDRSFARLLVATVQRRQGQIDKVLTLCCQQQPKKTSTADDFIQNVLRIGVAQLLFLDVPAHAAVKETVDLVRLSQYKILESRVKFVNAVLRRVSREKDTILSEAAAVETDNVAPWLLEEWIKAWGLDATQRIVAAAMTEAPRCLSVRVEPGVSVDERNMQIQRVSDLFQQATILPQGSVRVDMPPSGSVSSWPLFAEGAWWMQDPSATIPARAIYETLSNHGLDSVQDLHVVDLCAAPGGKTAQLRNYGFQVTAVEKSERRSRRLEENRERLRLDWDIVVADGSEWVPSDPVHAVLLDVPCTATGTGCKQPDVLRRESSYERLCDMQYRLFCHAVENILSFGGVLVYATCSLLVQEGEDQVEKVLGRYANSDDVLLKPIPFEENEMPGFNSAITPDGWMRVLPGSLSLPDSLRQSDGFFVARFRKCRRE